MNTAALTTLRPALTIKSVVKGAARWSKRIVLAAVLAATLFYLGLILLGYQPMVIVTGSMQKTIPVGSLVVAQTVDPTRLEVGDVISFEKPLGEPGIVTHRIVASKRDQGRLLYQTKGDSNPSVDPWAIHFDEGMAAHRMVFSVPYAGNALLLARSAPGRIALIALACLLILLTAFKAIATAAGTRGAHTPALVSGDLSARAAEPATGRTPSAPARPQTPTTSATRIPEVRPSSPGATPPETTPPGTTPSLPIAQVAVGGTVILLSIIGLRHLR